LAGKPDPDINWVWGPFGEPQNVVEVRLYFLACLAAYPVLIYLPTHGIIVFLRRFRLLNR
jgi:hypothetical protein